MAEDKDFIMMKAFVLMNEQQVSNFIDTHLAVLEGAAGKTDTVLPANFDHYAGIPIGVDVVPATVNGESGVFITDQFGDANVSYVGELLQNHIQMSNTQQPIGFQWADRTVGAEGGDFGGGATVVTARDIHTMTTTDWLESTMSKFKSNLDD